MNKKELTDNDRKILCALSDIEIALDELELSTPQIEKIWGSFKTIRDIVYGVKEEDKELTQLVHWAWSTKQLLEGILEDLNDGTLSREYNQDDLEFNIQSKLNSINGQIKVVDK